MFHLMTAKGHQFADSEDCAKAVLHLSADESLNGEQSPCSRCGHKDRADKNSTGRTFAIVSRSIEPQGYVDLEADDYGGGEVLARIRSLAPTESKSIKKSSL